MSRFDDMQIVELTRSASGAIAEGMKHAFTLAAIAATAALSACDNSDHTIVQGDPYDPQAEMVKNEMANVELPPAIVGSHSYRCKDNSVVKIDWLSNGKVNKARVTPQGGTTTTLDQPEADGAYTAEGTTLSGNAQAQTVTYNGKSCKR